MSAIDKDDVGVAHKAQPALHAEKLLSGVASESENPNEVDLNTSQPTHSETEASLTQEDQGQDQDQEIDRSNTGINAGSHDELDAASQAELLNDLVAAGSDIIGAKAFIKAQSRKRSPSIMPFGASRDGGSSGAAGGSGTKSAGIRWKQAQQRVSVLSAALRTRREKMLNHNTKAGGEEGKSHDNKNLSNGSIENKSNSDTVQGRGRAVARTSCLLDTLVALMTSPCLVQPLDRARALLWCHSILDVLVPKKQTKTTSSPDRRSEGTSQGALVAASSADAGTKVKKDQEEEGKEEEERSSQAPGQCRLLIVHAAAAALTDLPALLVRRFCAKLVSKTDAQSIGAEEESLRDATRRNEVETNITGTKTMMAGAVSMGATLRSSNDDVSEDDLLRLETQEEAAFAVAEALHRLGKRSGLAPAGEGKGVEEASSQLKEQSTGYRSHPSRKYCSSSWHRPEKEEWWNDLGLCLRGLQTACHLLLETSIGDPSVKYDFHNNVGGAGVNNQGGFDHTAGEVTEAGKGGDNWPNELVMRRYVQMLLADRDPPSTGVSHDNTIDALLDASARLAGRAPLMVGFEPSTSRYRSPPSSSSSAVPENMNGGSSTVPTGNGGKEGGSGKNPSHQKPQVAVVSPPHEAEPTPTFQKASANLAYVLSTVAMVRFLFIAILDARIFRLVKIENLHARALLVFDN